MTTEERLEYCLKNLQLRADKLQQQNGFCQNHRFEVQAKIYYDQWMLLNQAIQEIRLTCIDKLINP